MISYYLSNKNSEYLFKFNKNIHSYYILILLEYNKNNFEFHTRRLLKNSRYLEKNSIGIIRTIFTKEYLNEEN